MVCIGIVYMSNIFQIYSYIQINYVNYIRRKSESRNYRYMRTTCGVDDMRTEGDI